MPRPAIALLGLLVAGCASSHAPLQGTGDSGLPADSGPGVADSGPSGVDSGIVDSGVPDSGFVDAGPDGGLDAGAMGDGGASCWMGGSSCFGAPSVVHGSDAVTVTLGTADFNNDGFDDLIQAGYGLNAANPLGAITLFYGTSDGGMRLGPTIIEGTNPSAYASAATDDLNGDGWIDFVAVTGDDAIDIELNQADGSFNSTIIHSPPLTYAVQAADFDGDGRPDLAACTNTGVFIFFDDGGAPNYGDALPITPATEPDTESCTSLALGDLDGDGTTDIVSVENLPSYGLYVRLNSADAGFSLTTLETNCTTTAAGQIVVADLNGDGLPDVVCGTSTGIEVRFNQGGGTLGKPVDVGTTTDVSWYLQQVLVTDLNGDGLPDVFGAGSEANCDPDAGPLWANAYYFLNDGDGGFAVGQQLPTGQAAVHGISALHLPGTSLPSLAIGDWCTSDITIYPNGPVDAGM